MRIAWLTAVLLLAGCGDDSPGVGGNGAGNGVGGGGGGPGQGGGGEVVADPILERAPVMAYDCTEERPMTSQASPNHQIEGLVAIGDEIFVTMGGETLQVATLALDGSTSDPVEVVDTPFTASSSLTIDDGTDLVVVWRNLQAGGLSFARISSTLELVAGPTLIEGGLAGDISPSSLLPTETGFALLYGEDLGSATNLRFVNLDADGQPMGASVLVAELGEQYAAPASMTPTGDGGYAVTFVAGDSYEGEVSFVLLDADGSSRFPAKRISLPSTPGHFASFSYRPRRNIAKVGTSYWVAYAETSLAYPEGSTIIRVAVVDDEGNAALHALEAPVDQVENRSPTFVDLEDGLGLAWTTGSVIWECGGCITDYDMRFVVLDREALAPASTVVTHLHQANGILAPIVAVRGPDLPTAANLDFHASTLPATGAMRCVPSE
jgi:hypothetical protein